MKISLKKEIDIFHRLKLSLIIRGRDEKKGKILRSSLSFFTVPELLIAKIPPPVAFPTPELKSFNYLFRIIG